MLKAAYKLIEQESGRCLQNVRSDAFFTMFAKEKIRHTMQVAGAGNYLIRRIEWLKNRPSAYIEMVKTAVLLHDVCRFAEIEHLYHGEKGYDHGVGGAEFLRRLPRFSDIRIWLPIKHHGHLIEALYADEEYQNIADKFLQEEVQKICFIIRDVDKIANLHMLATEKDMRSLFLGKEVLTPQDGRISPRIKEEMYAHTTLPRWQEATPADLMAGFLSWYFDINYRYALDFCEKLNVTDRLRIMFGEICTDETFKTEFLAVFNQFLASHPYLR